MKGDAWIVCPYPTCEAEEMDVARWPHHALRHKWCQAIDVVPCRRVAGHDGLHQSVRGLLSWVQVLHERSEKAGERS